MNMRFSQNVLRVAREAALKAGGFVASSAGCLRARQISRKSANNYVTDIDRRSERVILDVIRRRFPDHGFLAEEGGASSPAEFTWIVDPIDGTSNFIHAFPMFAISIGVAHKGRVFAGVVYDPGNQELFSAAQGGGAFVNGRRIHVSRTKKLSDSLIATGIPFRGFNRFAPYMRSFKKISLSSAGIRRCGSAALDLAYVAAGRVDAYWETGLSPWDIAAGSLLVQEAGGCVTDLKGGGTFLETGDILASTGKIHTEMLRFTRAIPARERAER